MSDFIINCIQSGAYSALFAAAIVFIVKNGIKRENYYKAFISELCASLKTVVNIEGKLDGLIALAESAVEKKKRTKTSAQPVPSGGELAYDKGGGYN